MNPWTPIVRRKNAMESIRLVLELPVPEGQSSIANARVGIPLVAQSWARAISDCTKRFRLR